MASRSCPLCFVKLSRAAVLAHSDELICPSCHSALEVSRSSRGVAALPGVVAAYFAAHLTNLLLPLAAWFLAVVAAVLAYGFTSAVYLFFAADLTVRPKHAAAAFPQIHE